eukprot:CAMPEP_0185297476 /NCGR_PEP_ID=MMETSP1363-20130426/9872_1 /TAXON_ID=38817 /ORGANISM="Gephyrocapsa oceanica, Strain RCC1303" /LENGTH=33 /DNA_ID= /DNA_START= /DNA_END= /DNA_ORIENTATION=
MLATPSTISLTGASGSAAISARRSATFCAAPNG